MDDAIFKYLPFYLPSCLDLVYQSVCSHTEEEGIRGVAAFFAAVLCAIPGCRSPGADGH